MKYTLMIVLAFALFASSCGDAKKDGDGTLNDKKAQLQKLKEDQKKLNDEIAKVEAEIKKADPASAASTAKLITVTQLGTADFSHYIELQGRVDAQNISYVAPPNGQGGVVKSLFVTQGQNVRKGQVLARLDDAIIRQQIEPLRVQLAAARDTYRRTKNLWDQGIGTYQQVLSAETQMKTLENQIGIIQKQAAQMTVTAPSSGVADQVNIRVGEMFVGVNAMGPQIRIVNTGNLKIVAPVPENYAGRIAVGSKVKIVLPDQNNRTIDAAITVVEKVINPNTRSFNIEAKIPGEANLKPNQIAQVKILDYAASNVVTIPLNVIQTDEKGKYVYVAMNENGKMLARKKEIVTGEFYADRIEVKSGLAQGEQLITDGYQNLYEGQVVAIAK